MKRQKISSIVLFVLLVSFGLTRTLNNQKMAFQNALIFFEYFSNWPNYIFDGD